MNPKIIHPRSLAVLSCVLFASVRANTSDFDWPHYGHDAASTRFARLTQIDSTNIDQLRLVWRWRSPDWQIFETEDVKARADNKATPLVVDGVLYATTPLNTVNALDAATGRQLWSFDPQVWKQDIDFTISRGVAYWTDGHKKRLFLGTRTAYLYSIDAVTGKLDVEFGAGGQIDLARGLYRPIDERERYGVTSPPIICRDVVVVGSLIVDYEREPPPEYMIPGDVRGFDVHTGELLWTFHAVPQEGEFGNETWAGDSSKRFGGGNTWSTMSADHDLGYVYLPTSAPSHDMYGGERGGDNLFSNSLVCLDARTGERIWHYQFVHHGLWNYDLPTAPILLDIVVDGKPIKAVAQLTKQAFCFVFDRVTGEPVWPIEEFPAPLSTVPGEKTSRTQPYPKKPAPYDLQGLTEDDLIDFTPELRQEAVEKVRQYRYGALYTPPSEGGTISMPGGLGGSDWTGGAAHPDRGWLYVPSKTLGMILRVARIEESGASSRFMGHFPRLLIGPRGLPLTKPPYSRITAIDLNTGEHVWMTPVGTGPVDHPDLRDLGLPPLGTGFRLFILATPTLLLTAPAEAYSRFDQYYVDRDSYLFALDPDDGHVISRLDLPINASGNPMTYMADDRQYIVVPVGDGRRPAELLAMAIPRSGEELPPQGYARSDSDHPGFYEAVAAFDKGDTTSLRRLLREAPGLAHARGFLDSTYEHPQLRGATLLHLACGNPSRKKLPESFPELAETLLSAGADPGALTADSVSVLQLAIDADQPRWLGRDSELIAVLIDGGADVNYRGGYYLWDLLSAGEERAELVRLLVNGGLKSDLRLAAGLNDVALMSRFFHADDSLTDDAGAAYRIPPSHPDSAAALSDADILADALSFAAINGAREAAAFLLDKGADVNAMPARFHSLEDVGSTALHKTVDHCQEEVAELLLTRGADPDLAESGGDESPRQWAMARGCEEIQRVFETRPAAAGR